jgi:hypothetical protein
VSIVLVLNIARIFVLLNTWDYIYILNATMGLDQHFGNQNSVLHIYDNVYSTQVRLA